MHGVLFMLMAAMRGLIVIQEGASQIGKLRAPKTAAEVVSFLGRNGRIYDENEVGLIGSDSLEAGYYTFKKIDVPSIPAAGTIYSLHLVNLQVGERVVGERVPDGFCALSAESGTPSVPKLLSCLKVMFESAFLSRSKKYFLVVNFI